MRFNLGQNAIVFQIFNNILIYIIIPSFLLYYELKKYATAVILSNDEDGVAKWLEVNFDSGV